MLIMDNTVCMERVLVSVYWGPRRESVGSCAARLIQHFAALSEVSENLALWYHRGERKPKPEGLVDIRSVEALKLLLESGTTCRDDNHRQIRELGFGVGLWNGETGGWSASTDVHCGSYSKAKGLSNVALLSVGFDAKPALSPTDMVRLLKRFVEIWEPEHGKVWQNFWWPNIDNADAELRERVLADYRASHAVQEGNKPVGTAETFGRGWLWLDQAQEPFFKQPGANVY